MIRQVFLQQQKQFALETLEKLGWQINYEKSKLNESTKCQFIGFNVFSEGPNGPWIKVLPKKLHKIKLHIQVALSLRWVTAWFLAKIGGECIAILRAVLPTKLLLRNLYHTLSYRSSWDSVTGSKQRLHQRSDVVERCINIMEQCTPLQESSRDTSRNQCFKNRLGWNDNVIRGLWNVDKGGKLPTIQLS